MKPLKLLILNILREFARCYYRLRSPKPYKRVYPSELTDIYETVSYYTFQDGGSPVLDIALLKALSRFGANYFEIGTHRGESLVNIAEVLDPENCQAVSLEYAEPVNVELLTACHLWQGKSKDFDYNNAGKYDLIFIDGSHTYRDIRRDTLNCLKLMHGNSILVWHDYGFTSEKIRYSTLCAIHDVVKRRNMRGKIYQVIGTLCAVYFPHDLREYQEQYEVQIKFPY